jgi:anti-anti-sigma regulatory factor
MNSSQLSVDLRHVGKVAHIRLEGYICEDNRLKETIDRIDSNVAIINTAAVTRINSAGVREWVKWIEKLEAKGINNYFVECSPGIMNHVNLVINFIGSGRIVSFYAPYFCPQCSVERAVLLELDDLLNRRIDPPPKCRCSQCDHVLEFDESEDFFFSFLSWATPEDLSSEVAGVLREFEELPTKSVEVVSTVRIDSAVALAKQSTRGHETKSTPRLADALGQPASPSRPLVKVLLLLTLALLTAAVAILVCMAIRKSQL